MVYGRIYSTLNICNGRMQSSYVSVKESVFFGSRSRSANGRARAKKNAHRKGSQVRAVTISSYNGWWMSAKGQWMYAVKNQWLCACNSMIVCSSKSCWFSTGFWWAHNHWGRHTIIKVASTQSLILTAHIHWTLALIHHPLYELMVTALKSSDHTEFVQWAMNECCQNQWSCACNLNDCVLLKKQRDVNEHTIINVGTQSMKLQAHNHCFLTARAHSLNLGTHSSSVVRTYGHCS